jgi:hypothetical protein
MSKKKTYQFVRIQGFPRGSRQKRGTVGSIIAEGLRAPTHISHLPGDASIRVTRIDSPISAASELEDWILQQMANATNVSKSTTTGKEYSRGLRRDALAIGTFITSLPEKMEDFEEGRFNSFVDDTTKWVSDFLAPYEMIVHFRVDHFDEEYPHLHFWFTPDVKEKRTGNWSLANVCSKNKGFYHDLQKRFFAEVGYRYFSERTKPFEERRARLTRREAVFIRENEKVGTPNSLTISDEPMDIAAIDNVLQHIGKNLNESFKDAPDDKGFTAQLSRASLKVIEQLVEQGYPHKQLTEKMPKKPVDVLKDQTSPEMWQSWIKHALMPLLFKVSRQNSGRAAHLETTEWLSMIIEDCSMEFASGLTQAGLEKHPVGKELLQLLQGSSLASEMVAAGRAPAAQQARKASQLLEKGKAQDLSDRFKNQPGAGEDSSPWSDALNQ